MRVFYHSLIRSEAFDGNVFLSLVEEESRSLVIGNNEEEDYSKENGERTPEIICFKYVSQVQARRTLT
jgi:hypothetical protein